MTHINGIDLNLLPLLQALLDERHITRAARRVGLSQPAASRALGRLRLLLADPLLVRRGSTLVLTTRAEALREPLRAALRLLDVSLARPTTFDPAEATHTIRLASDDYGELVILRPLFTRLNLAAPGVDVQVQTSAATTLQRLVRGEVDLVFGPIARCDELPPGVRAEPLVTDGFVCMVGRSHPFARRAPTLQAFAAADHALIAPLGQPGGFVDDALAALGKQRRVALVLPHFMVMPFLVASSDLVLTLAERVARVYADSLPIVLFKPPFVLPSFTIGFLWHERDLHDPASSWLRTELAALRASLERSGPVRSAATPSAGRRRRKSNR